MKSASGGIESGSGRGIDSGSSRGIEVLGVKVIGGLGHRPHAKIIIIAELLLDVGVVRVAGSIVNELGDR